MSNIAIITDSASDIKQNNNKNITVLPLTVSFDDNHYKDGVDLTPDDFYMKLIESSTLPKTSQISPYDFEQAYDNLLKSVDKIIVVTLSSKLSGTYQSACLAASDVEDETGKKLYMVDSRSASIGTALLIREAVKLRDAGVNVSDIAAACTEMSKYIKLTAVVGSLKYLKMGGRLSGAAAFAGTMLHITPVVSIEDGKVVVIGKTRGKKAAEKLMHDKLTEDGLSLTRDFMFGHINCSESLETFINKSLTYISDVNGNVGVSSIGCSVGTHVGPGTYGIAYVEAAESGMNRESIVKTA